TNNTTDDFVHDRQTGTTELVDVNSDGEQGDHQAAEVSMSSDGRYVAFESVSTTLAPGNPPGFAYEIFVRDRPARTTERVSVDSAGNGANGDSEGPSISADGRRVAFESAASNLVGGDGNGKGDVFLHDRQTGATEREGIGAAGEANDDNGFPAL